MGATKIEWAQRVWNVITGCTPCSPGCMNCYAKRMANRLQGRFGYSAAPDQFRVTWHADKLDQPKHWRKPSRIFTCSMSDLFHEEVAPGDIDDIFDVMRACPQHTFIVLTKRAYRLPGFDRELPWPANIHLGVSICNQDEANKKIPQLLASSAAVKFISYEPALGPLNIGVACRLSTRLTNIDSLGLNWVVAGCESGPKRRHANLDWFRSIRDECIAAGVPYFLKQMEIDGKVVKMPELDGVVYGELPEDNRGPE